MMEIVGKILLVVGWSCLAAGMYSLVNSDFRKNYSVRLFLMLWGASLPMVILGAYVLAVV
jgi:hypothetical protein